MAAENPQEILLHVYDLSNGLAARVSMPLCGIQVDGIWHTAIVCFGMEWYFGQGISRCTPGMTHYGPPLKVERLGVSSVSEADFMAFLESIEPRYRAEHYHLLDHNCNTFTGEVSKFLTGSGIPSYIASLPADVLQSPMGPMIRPMVDGMMGRPGGADSAEILPASELKLCTLRGPLLAERGNPVAAVALLKRCAASAASSPGSAAASCVLSSDEGRALDAAAIQLLETGDLDATTTTVVLGVLVRIAPTLADEALFPLLEVVRFIELAPTGRRAAEAAADSPVLAILGQVVHRPMPLSVKVAVLRVLLNLFADAQSTAWALSPAPLELLCSQALQAIDSPQPWVRTTAAGLLYNMAQSLPADLSPATIEVLTTALRAVGTEMEAEIAFRLLMAVGVLLSSNMEARALALSMGFEPQSAACLSSPMSASPAVRSIIGELLTVMSQ